MAWSAAAPAARCRKFRRGSFIFEPPFCFTSLDHLVGAGEQDRRQVETQRSCCLEVDHELELGPLLDRQIGWFCTLEDFVDVGGGSIPDVFETSRIGEQATRLGHLPESADQRQTVARRRLRIAAREAMKVGSSSTKMASVGHARIDAKLGSKSSDPRASKLRKVNPSNPAVGSTSLMNIGCAGLPGFWRIAIRAACGMTSLSSSSRFTVSSVDRTENPVVLPPGCARPATKPTPNGSAAAPMTMGMLCVAVCAARTATVPPATMISTFALSSSPISEGIESTSSP